jgi:hypothetical protein
MYGISRIDDYLYRTHAWRVSLCRRGKRYVRNFADKKYGGKSKALRSAKQFRDELLDKYPPLTRKEFSMSPRQNNKSGITGVYCYPKKYWLKDGTEKECWYWEANWPLGPGESARARFSVNQYGEDIARHMAIRAREEGMKKVEGFFWASEKAVHRTKEKGRQRSPGMDRRSRSAKASSRIA